MRSKKKQKSLYCKVEGEIVQVTVKSHWQEPAVFFPDINPFVGGGE